MHKTKTKGQTKLAVLKQLKSKAKLRILLASGAHKELRNAKGPQLQVFQLAFFPVPIAGSLPRSGGTGLHASAVHSFFWLPCFRTDLSGAGIKIGISPLSDKRLP